MEPLQDPTVLLIFTTSFVVALSGALMPGPLLAVNIMESSRRGFWAGPLVVVGHGVVELALIAAVLGGLADLLKKDVVVAIVGLPGGLFLLWMAFNMIRTAPQQSLPQYTGTDERSNTSIVRPILSGAGASLSNPYWWIWWATAGLTYLVWSQELGTLTLGLFFIGHILADLLWYSGISGIVATGRKWITNRAYHIVLLVCGTCLIGLAIYFIIGGLEFLING